MSDVLGVVKQELGKRPAQTDLLFALSALRRWEETVPSCGARNLVTGPDNEVQEFHHTDLTACKPKLIDLENYIVESVQAPPVKQEPSLAGTTRLQASPPMATQSP
ncbi:hypothetical protein WJX72_008056 [[Myrmecia] bisecta]|uniref:Uncharacterized protein n=1 Tax=[Myrmecia] bisecta TaxID=41462 RepID=A0AAW1QFV9_9CHLO